MVEYTAVPATEAHALELAPVMSKADVDEVWAGEQRTPEQALLQSLAETPEPIAWLADGEVMFICGIGKIDRIGGVIWGLSAQSLPQHSRAFLRFSKNFVAEARKKHAVLLNFVDMRHTVAVRWLQWLGFEISPPEALGPTKRPFHMLMMRT